MQGKSRKLSNPTLLRPNVIFPGSEPEVSTRKLTLSQPMPMPNKELLHDFSSLIRSRDTDDHICHCMSTQKVHRSIVKMIVKFQLITVRSTTLDAFYCDFL